MGDREKFGLPVRPFLFTLDQIADMLNVDEQTVKRTMIYFHGVHVGVPPRNKLQARDITPQGETQTWRVAEKELIRWLRFIGFRVYDRGSVGEH